MLTLVYTTFSPPHSLLSPFAPFEKTFARSETLPPILSLAFAHSRSLELTRSGFVHLNTLSHSQRIFTASTCFCFAQQALRPYSFHSKNSGDEPPPSRDTYQPFSRLRFSKRHEKLRAGQSRASRIDEPIRFGARDQNKIRFVRYTLLSSTCPRSPLLIALTLRCRVVACRLESLFTPSVFDSQFHRSKLEPSSNRSLILTRPAYRLDRRKPFRSRGVTGIWNHPLTAEKIRFDDRPRDREIIHLLPNFDKQLI